MFVKKIRICSIQYLIFQRLLDLNYSSLNALNEANLTLATHTLNFKPTMHYRTVVKTNRTSFYAKFVADITTRKIYNIEQQGNQGKTSKKG